MHTQGYQFELFISRKLTAECLVLLMHAMQQKTDETKLIRRLYKSQTPLSLTKFIKIHCLKFV